MKVSLIQFSPDFGNVISTIKKLEVLILKNRLSDIIVLPELCNSGYNFENRQQAYELSETIENSIFIEFLVSQAKNHNLYIVSGFNEKHKDKIFNTSILISPSSYIGKYRKIHLFQNEKKFFSKGDSGLKVFDTELCKIGMLICYDWIFPEVWRILALKGADMICHPCSLVLPHAQKVIPVYSLINKIFIITSNRIGTERDITFTGQSIISNPNGEIIAKASDTNEELINIEIDQYKSRDKYLTPLNHIFEDREIAEYKEIISKTTI